MKYFQFKDENGCWVIVKKKFVVSIAERNPDGIETVVTTTKNKFIAQMDFDDACGELMYQEE